MMIASIKGMTKITKEVKQNQMDAQKKIMMKSIYKESYCDDCGLLRLCQVFVHQLLDNTTDTLNICSNCPTDESWQEKKES